MVRIEPDLIQEEVKQLEKPNFNIAKAYYKSYFYQKAQICLESLIQESVFNDDFEACLEHLQVMKLFIKTLIKITNFYKAKIMLQEFNLKLNLLKSKIENDKIQDLDQLMKYYDCFTQNGDDVTLVQSGYYNTAFPLLQQIVDENKVLINNLTLENLLKSLNNESDEQLFRYQLKVLLSLSKLHAYYFEYKTANDILAQLENNLVNFTQENESDLKPKVVTIKIKILNIRAKYYMNLQTYDKTKDVLTEIMCHQKILGIGKQSKYIQWLEILDMVFKQEIIDNTICGYKQVSKLISSEFYNEDFVTIKLDIKKCLILNKHHVFNLQLLYPEEFLEDNIYLAKIYKEDLDKLDPTGSQLFISLIQSCYMQFLRHSEFDLDSDQQLETYDFLKDMWKYQSDYLGDNNKFMDMIFYWNQLLIQSIGQSRIFLLQSIDQTLIFLNEVSIPFQLQQVKLNKMSLYKIFSALFSLSLTVGQMQNQQGIEIIQKAKWDLLVQINSLQKTSDGTIDFMEFCEKIRPFQSNLDLQEENNVNLKEYYDYLSESQRQIAEQLFHGEYYNYFGKLLQYEKLQILLIIKDRNIQLKEFSDIEEIDFLILRGMIIIKLQYLFLQNISISRRGAFLSI
eukprot:403362122